MLDKSVTIAPATLADSEAVREFLRLNYILVIDNISDNSENN